MHRLPIPSEKKDLPEDNIINISTPNETEFNSTKPIESNVKTDKPHETPILAVVPVESKQVEEKPEASLEKEEKPSDFIEENCVILNGQKIEIKPTKLKYFRNKAASAYGIIKAIPLHELLTYGKGQLDPNRDADQLLYDFLVAAFDDRDLVKENYDEMDADMIDKVCKIFGRINHINEKEEAARKNREAQEAKH